MTKPSQPVFCHLCFYRSHGRAELVYGLSLFAHGFTLGSSCKTQHADAKWRKVKNRKEYFQRLFSPFYMLRFHFLFGHISFIQCHYSLLHLVLRCSRSLRHLGFTVHLKQMGEECSACRQWEEGIYWNNFHSVQFFQSLSGRFHQQLAIPKKFADNMSEKLSVTVALKGPTGASWTVGLTASGDTLFFKKGWKKFVEDNCLEEDDVLMFKYSRDSCFDVLMFDGRSFCEKEASYFVRKCDHLELDSRGGTKKNYVTKSLEIVGDSSTNDSESGPSKELTTGEAWMPPPAGHHLRPKRLIQKAASSSTQEMSRRISGYPVVYESNRRPVTDEEREKALQLANEAVTEGSCIVVMRPSHVYKGFYMSIPAAWAAIHLPGKAHDVILRVPGDTRTWRTKYYNKGRGCGFSGGWKDFAIENFLEESDVCLFKIASETNIDSVVMDVTIFRVVNEVVAATRLNPSASRARKP